MNNYPGIERTKFAGVYDYFSDDTAIYERQVHQRTELISRSDTITISDSEAIMILIAIIRDRNISAEEIVTLPEIKKCNINLSAIQSFIEYHKLEKNSGFKALKFFKHYQDKLIVSVSTCALFSHMTTILFSPQIHRCPICDSVLHVQKTRTKSLVALAISAYLYTRPNNISFERVAVPCT